MDKRGQGQFGEQERTGRLGRQGQFGEQERTGTVW